MLGTELPEWRRRNRFTQDTLRMALGVKSRQTIITWEKSTDPLPRLVESQQLQLGIRNGVRQLQLLIRRYSNLTRQGNLRFLQ